MDQPAARIVRACLRRATASPAAISASCTASSAAAKSPYRRTTAPSTCGASSRSRCSVSCVEQSASSQPRSAGAHHLAHFDRDVQRLAARSRRRRRLRRDLVGALRARRRRRSRSRRGTPSLPGTVRRSPRARPSWPARPAPRPAPASPCASTSSPASVSSLLKRCMNAMCALRSSGVHVPMPAVVPAGPRGVHHQHVLHLVCS